MRVRLASLPVVIASTVVLFAFGGIVVGSAEELSLEKRLAAQETITRVYAAHVDGAGTFRATPHAVLERNVRNVLDRSAAWEARHHTPITRGMLLQEWQRIQRSTRLPDRLRELREALNDDPLVLEECLARPALLERLEAIDRAAEAGNEPEPDALSRPAAPPDPAITTCSNADNWTPISSLGAPSPRYYHTAVWTGTEMIVWGGTAGGTTVLGDGGRYDPLLDLWRSMTAANAPSVRYLHTAVWTGSEMIIWGGSAGGSSVLGDGGRYDPISDHWSPTSLTAAPAGRHDHTAVWSGTRMIVWGGAGLSSCSTTLLDGGQYDPATNTWTPTAIPSFLESRILHSAVWTGSEMIVWGGLNVSASGTSCNSAVLVSGGRYDPVSNTWQAMTTAGAPFMSQANHRAVWTGTQMLETGWGPSATYRPSGNTWSNVDIGYRRSSGHTAVLSADRAIMWGGYPIAPPHEVPAGFTWLETGSVWSGTTLSGAPTARMYHSAVWTGNVMIVWGGIWTPSGAIFGNGASYLPGDNDIDGDGVCSSVDNCPLVANASQADADADGKGDACDNCRSASNPDQADADHDGSGDACDVCPFDANNDSDHDSVCGNVDNCPSTFNAAQRDTDGDGVGDLCDLCPTIATGTGEIDSDGDGRGNNCDCQPNDPNDRLPADPKLSVTRTGATVAHLSWPAVVGTDVYAVTRAARADLTAGNYGPCLVHDLAATSRDDPSPPGPGQAWFYLVQGQSFECGVGSLGVDSLEHERVNTNPAACAPATHTDTHPSGEGTVYGSVANTYLATAASDNGYEILTEAFVGGFYLLDHHWVIVTPSGSRQELHIEAYNNDRPPVGGSFSFEYSTDGGAAYTPITVGPLSTYDNDIDFVVALPASLSGNILIRVLDTDHTTSGIADRLLVDEMWIRTVP